VLLLTESSLCLWLRQCIDARDFGAARKIESWRTSVTIDRLETVSKSQRLAERKESHSTTGECVASFLADQTPG